MNYKDGIQRILCWVTTDCGHQYTILLEWYGAQIEEIYPNDFTFDLTDYILLPEEDGMWVLEFQFEDDGDYWRDMVFESENPWRRPDEAEWMAIQEGVNPWPRTLCYI